MVSLFHNNFLYTFVEMQRKALEPLRALSELNRGFNNEYLSGTKFGRTLAAGQELFERTTRQYEKPEFGIKETLVGEKKVKIKEKTVISKVFCNLLHFQKEGSHKQPKMLVVAPMSGHYATLLRGTVEGLLPEYDVYITDWINARDIPVEKGYFKFDDFVNYTMEFVRYIGKNTHVMAVCQPSVPVLAAAALMAEDNDPMLPETLILMGGPIDSRKNPTQVNDYAAEKTILWLESSVITKVPANYPGYGRSVYPGFMQLSGFMAMNLQNHMNAHLNLFNHLVEGDGESADAHKKFYNEYLSVMDLPSEFYLDTVNIVFKGHLLPKGQLMCNGRLVKPEFLKKTALLCIEGEKDDISGRGQTKAALNLCKNIPDSKKSYYLQKGVGHYGIFNGRRYRQEVVPAITGFIKKTSASAKKMLVEVKKPKAATKPKAKKVTSVKKPAAKATASSNTKKVAVKKVVKAKAQVKKKAPAKKVAAKPATAKKPAKKPAIKKAVKSKTSGPKKSKK